MPFTIPGQQFTARQSEERGVAELDGGAHGDVGAAGPIAALIGAAPQFDRAAARTRPQDRSITGADQVANRRRPPRLAGRIGDHLPVGELPLGRDSAAGIGKAEDTDERRQQEKSAGSHRRQSRAEECNFKSSLYLLLENLALNWNPAGNLASPAFRFNLAIGAGILKVELGKSLAFSAGARSHLS